MKKYLLIIFTTSAFLSCGKFLEPKSQNEYVPKTVNAISEMLLHDAYANNADVTCGAMFCYNIILDDDIEMNTKNIKPQGNLATANQALFSWQPDTYIALKEATTYNKTYQAHYTKIKGCNVALDYLDGVEGVAIEKDYIRAQAYMLRGFYYFNIVNIYGKPYNFDKNALGVPLKLDSNYDDKPMKRNTVEEVYAQIIKDLDAAETAFEKLPATMHFRKNYRVTYPALQLLRARVALYMEDYETAKTYASKVMNNWGLSLYNLSSFVPSFDAPYPNYVTFTNSETMWAYGRSGDLFFFTFMRGYEPITSGGTSYYLYNASQLLLNCYAPGDLRKEYYIAKEKAASDVKMPWGKCVITSTYIPIGVDNFAMSMRLSEAYLIYAEAVAQKDPSEAMRVINELRSKRFENYEEVQVADTDVLNFINEERRREMCFEGHRWFDLRRHGMPSFSRTYREYGEDIKVYTINKNDPAYTVPLPEDVMLLNLGLVQNELTQPK